MRSSDPHHSAAALGAATKRAWFSFLGNRRGAVAAYAGTAAIALFGVGVLSIDIGQVVITRNQMQNAADSAALGAAAHLDGRPGAIQRATEVAQNLALDDSTFASNGTSLSVTTVTFYNVFDRVTPANNVVTTLDSEANYVRVDMAPKNMNFLLEPVFDGLLGATDQDFTTLNSYAVAEYAQMDCDIVPMFVCSSVDPNDSTSVFHDDNIGRMLVTKMGPGSPLGDTNGNFGMLTPVDVNGELTTGANAVNNALEALTYPGCIGSTATTAPGSQTNQVKWGINARFGTGNGVNRNYAADILIDYPRDTLFQGISGGRGGADPAIDLDPAWTPETHWDPETFWYDMYQVHDAFGNKMTDGFGNPLMLNDGNGVPMESYNFHQQDIIDAHPNNPNGIVTRYGMYLHQLSDEAHFVIEDNMPMTREPQSDCSQQASCVGIDRRRIKIAVVHCGDGTPPTQDVQGATEIEVNGQYLDIFLTAVVDDPSGDATVYAEIVGDSSGDSGGSQDEISNVRLVD